MAPDIGGAVAYLAWRKHLSHTDLAKRMGVHKSYMCKLCSRGMQTYLAHLPRLAVALGVSLADLLAIAQTPVAAVFGDPISREAALNMPLSRKQRNEIVRFVNKRGQRRECTGWQLRGYGSDGSGRRLPVHVE